MSDEGCAAYEAHVAARPDVRKFDATVLGVRQSPDEFYPALMPTDAWGKSILAPPPPPFVPRVWRGMDLAEINAGLPRLRALLAAAGVDERKGDTDAE